MIFHGLKTSSGIYLAILLFIGMILTAFVMMSTSQNDLITLELSKAGLFAASIEKNIQQISGSKNTSVDSDTKQYFKDLVDKANYSCLMIQLKETGHLLTTHSDCALQEELTYLSKEALRKNKIRKELYGTTWGTLWKGRQHMLIAIPVAKNGEVIGGIGLVKDLGDIYSILRRSQQLSFIFIIVNTIILTIIGLYLLSRKTVRPLKRLVARAEDYKEDGEMLFLYEKGDNEFAKLSKSLNRLLQRISVDKEKLQASVLSLEKANVELREAQKDIIKAEKLASVGRLSSGIAHEIGNPIGIIMGYLDLLKQGNLSAEEKKDFIQRAENEVEKINGIIRQLLNYARPSIEELKEVSVHEIIHDIEQVVSVQPMMANVQLAVELKADMDTVFADPDQLRQVFLNLMINAVDAIHAMNGKDTGKVIISSEVVHGGDMKTRHLKITYTDNGIGIPEETIVNIFDPFYTTKEPGKGTGLGLSVSFMIIEDLGGKIEATSQEGQGTTMAVMLPLSCGEK